MTLQQARLTYQRSARAVPALTDEPHVIIGVVLGELHSALTVLATAARNQSPLPSEPMARSLSAIYLLQSSLDFEKGGEIAPSLFRLYEFCREQIVMAFRKEEEGLKGLALAAEYIGSIREAWGRMDRAARP
jgi:flagellar secretion chaperone FliS